MAIVRSLAVRAVFSVSGLIFSMGLKKFTVLLVDILHGQVLRRRRSAAGPEH